MENDGDYDATSKALTSTEVNTMITDIEEILEAIKPDATQALKDVIIKEMAISKINALHNFLRAQGKNTIEPGEPQLMVTLDDLKPIHVKALNGNAGKTYPRFSVTDLR